VELYVPAEYPFLLSFAYIRKYILKGLAPIFFSDSATFHGGWPVRNSFTKTMSATWCFAKTRRQVKERLITSLTYSKHPADVIKKEVRYSLTTRVVRDTLTSFLNAARFSNKSNADCNQCPASSNSLPKHHTHPYRNEFPTGAAGKALNVGARKVVRKCK